MHVVCCALFCWSPAAASPLSCLREQRIKWRRIYWPVMLHPISLGMPLMHPLILQASIPMVTPLETTTLLLFLRSPSPIRFSGSNSSHNPFFILSSRFSYLQDLGRMLITPEDATATEQHGPRQHIWLEFNTWLPRGTPQPALSTKTLLSWMELSRLSTIGWVMITRTSNVLRVAVVLLVPVVLRDFGIQIGGTTWSAFLKLPLKFASCCKQVEFLWGP